MDVNYVFNKNVYLLVTSDVRLHRWSGNCVNPPYKSATALQNLLLWKMYYSGMHISNIEYIKKNIITPAIPSHEYLQTVEQGNADSEQTDL